MLSDRHLIVVSLVLAFLGTGALYVLLLVSELPVSDLTVVEKANEAATVRVVATVAAVRHGKNSSVTILTLSEEVERTAVIFDTVNVSRGAVVDVVGEVQMYEGEPELIIRSLAEREGKG